MKLNIILQVCQFSLALSNASFLEKLKEFVKQNKIDLNKLKRETTFISLLSFTFSDRSKV